MRFEVPLPPDWPQDVHLELVHPRLRPCDPRRWARELLGAEAAGVTRLVTDDGWPFELISVAEAQPPRCVAIYALRDHVAAVVVTGVSETTPVIERALRAARADWRSDSVVALVELWRAP